MYAHMQGDGSMLSRNRQIDNNPGYAKQAATVQAVPLPMPAPLAVQTPQQVHMLPQQFMALTPKPTYWSAEQQAAYMTKLIS